MKSFFDGQHYYDLAKQAKFKPHPLLALLLFLLVFYAAQSISGIPLGVCQFAIGSQYDADILDIALNQVNYTQSDAEIIMVVQLFSTAFVAALVLLYCRFAEGRSIKSMGLSCEKLFKRYGLGLIIGAAAFSAVVGVSVMVGAVKYTGTAMNNGLMYSLICIGWIIQGAEEEIVCRGFLMTTLSTRLPMWAAVVINSVFFSAMHLMNPGMSVLALINIALIGIAFSLLAVRCNSLIPSCAFHSVWNWAQGNFYGLPVSGMNSGSSVLRFELSEGMELWTGGKFGLESGLATTIVSIVLIALFLLLPKKKTAE